MVGLLSRHLRAQGSGGGEYGHGASSRWDSPSSGHDERPQKLDTLP